MQKAVALNASLIDLTDSTILSTLFDSLLDETMRCLSECDDENEGLEKQMEMVAFTSAILRGDVGAMPLADEKQPAVIAARLKAYFSGIKDTQVLVETVQDDGEYIFIALCMMTKDFVQLLMTSSQADETQEVFDLRRDALVAEWVKRFLA